MRLMLRTLLNILSFCAWRKVKRGASTLILLSAFSPFWLATNALAQAKSSTQGPNLAQSAPSTVTQNSPLDAFKRTGIALSDVSVYVIGVDQSEPKLTLNADLPFVMASTTKLVTSLAALDLLGPKYKWRTLAFLNGKLEAGSLTGDLLIVGGGDPSLKSERLIAWFKQLQKRGLREINGNIILDRHRFALTDKDHANTPQPDWRNPHHAYPDALVVDEGVFSVKLNAGPKGKKIEFTPAVEGIEVVDNSKTLARCALVKKPLEVDQEDTTSHLRFTLSGEWAPDCPDMQIDTLPWDQVRFSQAAVLSAWKQAGGLITGSVIEEPAPVIAKPSKLRSKIKTRLTKLRKPFAVLESKPLTDSLREVNKWSNNLVSRNITLSLSKDFPVVRASLASAQTSIHEWLQAKGFAADDIRIENGSGLSRNERAKASSLARLLREAWNSRDEKEFKETLSIVGVDGTMGGRLKQSAANGKALIKTGTLSDTRAVAGYVNAADGKHYVIVAMVNHPNAARAVNALDGLIDWVYRSP